MESGVGVGVIRMCRRWRIRRGVVFRSGSGLRGGMLLLLDENKISIGVNG